MDLSSVEGLVQRSVDTINAAIGSTARDHGRSGSARHGSAEQGSGTRAGSRTTRRERDRGRASTRDDASVRDDHRLQNLQDLEGILEVLNDRLDTLERLTRMHGQSIAAVDESLTNHRAQSRAFGDDVEKYKQFITGTHVRIDQHITKQVADVNEKTNALHAMYSPILENTTVRVQVIEDMLTAMSLNQSSAPPPVPPGIPPQTAPETFQMNTPAETQPAPQPVPEYVVNDPWSDYAARTRGNQGEPDEATGNVADFPTPSIGSPIPTRQAGAQAPQPAARPVQRVGVPPSFAGPQEEGAVGSPFFRQADPFQTPTNANRGPNFTHPGDSAWAGGRTSIFEISYKKNERLFVFTQDPRDFKLWRDRVVDHLCRSTQRWRGVLDFVQQGLNPIGKAWLQSTNIDGVNAWDLSTMLEAFLVNYFPKGMYNRRVQLAGGSLGNGFEMWRQLYLDYQGGSDAVQFGGVRRLQEFPKCTSMSKLSEHLDDWTDVLHTYGEELAHCPKLLKNMLLGVLPKALEDEVLEKSYKPEFQTYESIIAWAKRRVINVRQKELSEFSRRPTSGHVKSMRYDEPNDDDNDDGQKFDFNWTNVKKEIVNVMREAAGQVTIPPPPIVDALQKRPPRKTDDKARRRADSPKGGKKLFFKGCWHCGKEEPKHSRKECPDFLRVLKAANPGISDRSKMKLPQGYKGAYEKAREAAGLKNRDRRVNMLEDEDFDDTDSDSDIEAVPGRMCALRGVPPPPTPHPEPRRGREPLSYLDAARMSSKAEFCALANQEDDYLSQDNINSRNDWNVKVSRKSERAKKVEPRRPKLLESFTVKTEQQLDQLLSRHPRLAAIPDTDKKIRKILRTMPAQLVCGPDEILCLVDSGSTVNAAWIEKHFPAYMNLVRQTKASLRGDSATTAGGHKLVNKGRCVVNATADDQAFPVAFKDMETELPILSVRKMVKRQNDVQFGDEGGFIRNRESGKQIPFFEHEGVYFLKLKVAHPKDNGQQPDLGFAWPGM